MVLTLTCELSNKSVQILHISQVRIEILFVKQMSKAKSSANLSSITTPFGVIAISFYNEIVPLVVTKS